MNELILQIKEQPVPPEGGGLILQLVEFTGVVPIGHIELATHSGIVRLSVIEPLDNSELLVMLPDGIIGALNVVEPETLYASPVRVSTHTGVKAISFTER